MIYHLNQIKKGNNESLGSSDLNMLSKQMVLGWRDQVISTSNIPQLHLANMQLTIKGSIYPYYYRSG